MPPMPWSVRSAGWPVLTKMTPARTARGIGRSSSCFENLASVRVNEPPADPTQWVRGCHRADQPPTVEAAELWIVLSGLFPDAHCVGDADRLSIEAASRCLRRVRPPRWARARANLSAV